MDNKKLSAIILTAARSSRMGKFKPPLSVGGQTVIGRTVTIFKKNASAHMHAISKANALMEIQLV